MRQLFLKQGEKGYSGTGRCSPTRSCSNGKRFRCWWIRGIGQLPGLPPARLQISGEDFREEPR
jgi:hypothetical protein